MPFSQLLRKGANAMPKKIGITETVLRDAHQSLIATRMSTEEMLPILSTMDKVGFASVECWGGATFDTCIRFLNEDPWDRLRTLRREMPNSKLQMLFRGQNMLGYRHYADDVLEYFVQKSVSNGIDIIRIFDALNDIRNLRTAIKAAKKEGALAEVAISYTVGEIFTDEYFCEYAKQIEAEGADSICIKDMAALLTPYKTESLVKALKAVTKLPIHLHTHYTSGLASMCMLKGIEAGADVCDTAMSPLANGTSHMPTESLVAALQGTEYDTGLDLVLLNEVRDYFMTLRAKYLKSGKLDQKMLAVDPNALIYQVPGGMLSNLLSQLKQAGKEDKFTDVLKEVPNVRKDSGNPPLVTPTSQIVGSQAVFNIIGGERYKTVTSEFREMVAGRYGKTPTVISDEFSKKILGDEKAITCRPADLLEPELEKLKAECSEWTEQDEDVLTYAMFPKVAPKFFKDRRDKKYGVDKNADSVKQIHTV
jgi:oxaloacetate decarboxylase alpha subunit